MSQKKATIAYEDVTQEMSLKHKAEASQMFGMPTLKIKGKAFAVLFDDKMVFKLTDDDHAKALKLKGAKLFQHLWSKRTMKEWVQVPAIHSKQWLKFAESALKYVKKKT